MTLDPDAYHKRQYEAARPMAEEMGIPFPNWEDLTDEQRTNIRKTNDEAAQYFNKLGQAIATGGPLPDPFE